MIGIYKFENLVNGKKYIGQSVNIERRYKDHIVRAKNNFINNTEYDSSLHKAMRKYGINNFSFEILEECEKIELNEKERYWIAHYNSYHKGYNETSGGDANEHSVKFNEEFIKKIQQILLTTTITYEEIHQEYHISLGRISEINTGKIWYNPQLSYPLRSKKKIYTCKNCGKVVSQGQNRCAQCSHKEQRKVAERPSREELKAMIYTLSFTSIAQQYGVTDNCIRKWCDAYNLPRTKKEITKYSPLQWDEV